MIATGDVDLLLLGKTGKGLSAVGNAILKWSCFKSCSSSTSVTKEVDFGLSKHKGQIIKVIDGPSVGNTSLKNEDAVKLVVDAMTRAISINTQGFHAFLLVLRFGGRFTAEDLDAIALLKRTLGPDIVRNFCILVMTCGDIFEREAEVSRLTFGEWCRTQTGMFRELLEECQERIVLFDNVTKNAAKQDRQIDQLLSAVYSLGFPGYNYTKENFKLARAMREKALIMSKMPGLREEILDESKLIFEKFERVIQEFKGEKRIPFLEELLEQCDELNKNIQEQDNGTDSLHKLENYMGFVRKSICEVISLQTALATEKRHSQKRPETLMNTLRMSNPSKGDPKFEPQVSCKTQ